MKQIGPSEIRRILNSQPLFSIQKFREAEDKPTYVTTLLCEMFIKHQIKNSTCNLNELTTVMKELGFELTMQQKHEVFLFALSEQKFTSKAKLFNIINDERKKINVEAIVQWIMNNIEKIKVRQQLSPINRHKLEQGSSIERQKEREKQKIRSFSQNKGTSRFPQIKPRSKLEEKLEPLIQIFDKMKKIRQQSGLIPYNFDQDQDALDTQFNHIPYDPNMSELHAQIGQLKLQAQEHLKGIIELARGDSRIRTKLEEGVERFQKLRIEANQKVGRAGAVNAQKRLAEKRRKELERLRTMKFEFTDDIVRAAKIYRIMNNPELKIKPVF